MGKRHKRSAPLPYVALLLAFAVPGAGHAYLGRLKRGIVIFATIGGLFWSGVAVGGVLTVDCYLERWWFIAEMFAGVHGLVGWYRQRQEYEQRLRDVPGRDIEEKARQIGRDALDARMQEAKTALIVPAETVARAYAGVAGLLNLMCVFDALMLSIIGVSGEPPQEEEPQPKPKGRKT